MHRGASQISASAGVSLFPVDGRTTADLVHKADMAMYHAKRTPDVNWLAYCEIIDPLRRASPV